MFKQQLYKLYYKCNYKKTGWLLICLKINVLVNGLCYNTSKNSI